MLRRDANLEVTLVNRENVFLFTPMLHEVAASDIDMTHIVNPIRELLRRVTFVQGLPSDGTARAPPGSRRRRERPRRHPGWPEAALRVKTIGLLASIGKRGGVSPAWPVSYEDMEPYYARAEHLYHVQ